MNTSKSYRAWLGLGGNIDDPVASMGKALRMLDARADTNIVGVSAVYRTPPWGKTDQAWFHNACAEVETSLQPLELIATCLDVERSLKRVRLERWGPRIIDIDILAMQDEAGRAVIMTDAALVLPHPRMHERAFVLVPLNDIAPSLEIGGKTIADWNAGIEQSGIEKARTDAGWWRE
ncbi:2-amino-4-hydroxy-6-hydroxymethyldihydropteridine diphosphokinase [Ochrobactrum intermedium]|uniref:2-amino-4-hydroxy-6-hydroxymethyldihydropteridine pyrophosphokinase n=2 Tax=Brucella intermedia TaxID=94625 RepID=A0ABR6AJW3_9HYPH|nr:2-amino-4-hydroxy-6-hydroxymethyldihydropteridine pyrophosphokinase [Ochrobactrum sp. EGD-AQ16]KAB2697142.1 2-amino-4-hydroxy-6-hydroxymethyldihydropteridine diphosphokinase [Brucella intermedia]KAB2712345.1 2-amino-4-hydroxy-6-hydroxymethyldihydropteridine diphosphokinase [Brucella intermedia]MBA8849692.1 2-amino-4-hydroxy-6-hydroxymethyldihydropteridine diphosphokinase [Brucella intermedia]NVM41144.1 2-amino-4-hydroxy-6-hydroxymethyldihydropteridine diphosphokinase [Brucella intermedia]